MRIILKPGAVVLLLLMLTGLSVLAVMRVRAGKTVAASLISSVTLARVKRDIIGKKRFDSVYIADATAAKSADFLATDLPSGVAPEATRFEVTKPLPNIWDIHGAAKIAEPMKAGEAYTYRLWARSPTSSKISVTLEETDAPFTNVFVQETPLTQEWKEYTFSLTAAKDFAPGFVSVRVRAALSPGVVEATVPSLTPQ